MAGAVETACMLADWLLSRTMTSLRRWPLAAALATLLLGLLLGRHWTGPPSAAQLCELQPPHATAAPVCSAGFRLVSALASHYPLPPEAQPLIDSNSCTSDGITRALVLPCASINPTLC